MTHGRDPLQWVKRAARLAYTFVVLNYSAVAGLGAALMRKKVWR